jgi:hypothetical protein
MRGHRNDDVEWARRRLVARGEAEEVHDRHKILTRRARRIVLPDDPGESPALTDGPSGAAAPSPAGPETMQNDASSSTFSRLAGDEVVQ